jgi:hypothetical protein
MVQGMPMAIIELMASEHSFSISMLVPSIGIILQTMPSFPISQVMRTIIGRIIGMGIIIGIGMPIIPLIMGFIIGIGMPMPIIGFMPIMPFIIGIDCMGMEFIIGMGSCIAFIMGSVPARAPGRLRVKIHA